MDSLGNTTIGNNAVLQMYLNGKQKNFFFKELFNKWHWEKEYFHLWGKISQTLDIPSNKHRWYDRRK